MFDETVFTNFMMDMATLEATMTVFDYEHGLTPEYLASDYDEYYDDVVTESTYGSVVDGLFEEDFAPATEGFKETMGKIGKGIKVAMITVVGAIKKAFITLGNNISNWFNSLIEKHQRKSAEKDPYVRALMMNPAVRDCCNMVATTFKALSAQVASANVQLLPIINRINKALSAAAIGNSSKAKPTDSEMADVGERFTKSYMSKDMSKTSNDDTDNLAYKADRSAAAEKDIDDSEQALNRLADQLKTVQDILSSKDERFAKLNGAASVVSVTDTFGTNEKMSGKKIDKNGNMTDTKMQKKASPALVQKAIFMNVEVSTMQKLSRQITAACSQHAKACESIVKNCEHLNTDDGNPAAKRGYRLCQIYMRASKYFSQISMMCTKVLTFKTGDVKDLGVTGVNSADNYTTRTEND